MFPASYFAPRYFGTRYWPPVVFLVIVAGGAPGPEKGKRKRRYLLPDGRSFEDPQEALIALHALLKGQERPQATPKARTKRRRGRKTERSRPVEPVARKAQQSELLAVATYELPVLIERAAPEIGIDIGLVRALEEIRREEENAIVTILLAT